MNSLRKIWKFLWNDDTPLSWIVSIGLAFVIVKFLVYPSIGLLFGTSYPIVAVVSSSMEHPENFDKWWEDHEEWYTAAGIIKEDFSNFKFRDGFNKGDIMLVFGNKSKDINIGDVLIFESTTHYPVIHRVVGFWEEGGRYNFHTKGDNNQDSYSRLNEKDIHEDRVLGVARMRIPLLGWIKIMFTKLLGGLI